jgi:hypothetical protein
VHQLNHLAVQHDIAQTALEVELVVALLRIRLDLEMLGGITTLLKCLVERQLGLCVSR